MRVTVHHLVKRFGNTTALRAVSLAVESQELFFLLGPSGCGKTTLLRTLAGFYQPDDGEIRRFKVFEQNPRLIREVGVRLELHVRPADLLILPRD